MAIEWLLNARIPGHDGLQDVVVEDGRVLGITPIETGLGSRRLPHQDLREDWLSLGGVDLQINGALGLAFPELTAANVDHLDAIGQFLWQAGVDGYCPTIVTTSIENIHRAIGLIRDFTPKHPHTAQILGVHLEGPCLNHAKRGAHPAEFLQPLTIDVMQGILANYADTVRIITLAPELDPTETVVAYLRDQGITVSLGHSQATAAEANQAFNQGATMVTHAFNAMPPLHHREPGMLGAAIVDPRVTCGFIADGEHICPTMLKLLLQASGPTGLFLVSDALSPLGLPDGRYPWDSREITVTNGTARLDDGTLSGTTRSLLQGVQNLVAWEICPIETAITLATIAPRQAIGLPTELRGRSVADLVRWRVEAGLVRGWLPFGRLAPTIAAQLP